MQIKILSLTVKNCGTLKDIKVDFTDNGQPQSVVALSGINGSGKTTILELIFALIELFQFTSIEKYGSIKGVFTQAEYAELELLIDQKRHSVFFYESTLFNTKQQLNNKHGIINQSTHTIQLSDISEYIGNLIALKQHKANAMLSNYYQTNFIKKTDIPTTLYFPHNREILPVHGKQIYQEETEYQWCYRYKNKLSFHGSLESYLIWLNYAEPEIFKSVIDFMNQLDLEGKTFYINRKKLKIMVRTNNSVHSFDKLSSGEQNILIILLELYRRLTPDSIVLIDEIENSLHPAFQHHLAQNLLKLQQQIPFQLILTTHQPAFLKNFDKKCERRLTKF